MLLDYKKFDLFNTLIFEKAIMAPPFRPPGDMQNQACFMYVIEGGQQTLAANEKIILKAKDAVLMKCGLYFTDWITGTNFEKCEAIGIHLYPEVLKKIYANELPEFLKQPLNKNTTNVYKVAGNELVDAYMQSMLFYFNNPQLVDEELLVLKLKELVLLLMKTEKAGSVMDIISSLFSPKTYQFKEVIQAHLFSNISIEELAAFTNLSLSSFKREFEKIYSDTPARYLKNKKLEKAKELLARDTYRISDVAYETGFSDVAHFSRSFQEKYNITPSAYRLNQKGKTLD